MDLSGTAIMRLFGESQRIKIIHFSKLLNMTNENNSEQEHLLRAILNIDRFAGMGVLAAGMIHAMNNYLGGITGHVDLMLLSGSNDSKNTELAGLETICDEAIVFTRSLNEISIGFKGTGPADLFKLLNAFTVFARRIFRSSKIEVGDFNSAGSMFAGPACEVTQSVFHLTMICRDLLIEAELTEKTMLFEVATVEDEYDIRIVMPGFEINRDKLNIPDAIPDNPDSIESHLWMLDHLCRRNGRWYPDSDNHSLNIRWPVTSGPSGIIF